MVSLLEALESFKTGKMSELRLSLAIKMILGSSLGLIYEIEEET
jgi:hypothetical protein